MNIMMFVINGKFIFVFLILLFLLLCSSYSVGVRLIELWVGFYI